MEQDFYSLYYSCIRGKNEKTTNALMNTNKYKERWSRISIRV
jgi:hypothetical protein